MSKSTAVWKLAAHFMEPVQKSHPKSVTSLSPRPPVSVRRFSVSIFGAGRNQRRPSRSDSADRNMELRKNFFEYSQFFSLQPPDSPPRDFSVRPKPFAVSCGGAGHPEHIFSGGAVSIRERRRYGILRISGTFFPRERTV